MAGIGATMRNVGGQRSIIQRQRQTPLNRLLGNFRWPGRVQCLHVILERRRFERVHFSPPLSTSLVEDNEQASSRSFSSIFFFLFRKKLHYPMDPIIPKN